ncbi:MAG: hypothetical protein AB1773_00940 [Pseudomonadota bacterium]
MARAGKGRHGALFLSGGRQMIVVWLSESEVREYYGAVFLSVYLASIWWRLRRA